MNTLPELIVGKLPPGQAPCTACGAAINLRSKGIPRNGLAPRTTANAEINGCISCGHLMIVTRNAVRDLTRAEAAELAASLDFPRVRAVVEAAVKHLVG